MYRFDTDQLNEFEPSTTTQLDVVGMQPHAREYLEYQVNCNVSTRKFEQVEHQTIDYCDGIQFTGKP
jgi:hypothetical protein